MYTLILRTVHVQVNGSPIGLPLSQKTCTCRTCVHISHMYIHVHVHVHSLGWGGERTLPYWYVHTALQTGMKTTSCNMYNYCSLRISSSIHNCTVDILIHYSTKAVHFTYARKRSFPLSNSHVRTCTCTGFPTGTVRVHIHRAHAPGLGSPLKASTQGLEFSGYAVIRKGASSRGGQSFRSRATSLSSKVF